MAWHIHRDLHLQCNKIIQQNVNFRTHLSWANWEIERGAAGGSEDYKGSVPELLPAQITTRGRKVFSLKLAFSHDIFKNFSSNWNSKQFPELLVVQPDGEKKVRHIQGTVMHTAEYEHLWECSVFISCPISPKHLECLRQRVGVMQRPLWCTCEQTDVEKLLIWLTSGVHILEGFKRSKCLYCLFQNTF